MIRSFAKYLVEEEKAVYFTFGRMNPPTIGHEKVLNTLAKKAGKKSISSLPIAITRQKEESINI